VVAASELVCGSADVGIDGNEMVDRIAKESAESGNLYRLCTGLYRHEQIQLWSQLSTSNRPICVCDILALCQ
jgi:hypothetical protein